MCRILGIRSVKPFSPALAVQAMQTMQLGHDNSGFALVMQGLGGEFEGFQKFPALSMACTGPAQRKVEDLLEDIGFVQKLDWRPHDHDSPHFRQRLNVNFMPKYVFRFYRFPRDPIDYENESFAVRSKLLVDTTLKIRQIEGAFVYSFWPDTITIKEIGDPWDISLFFGLTEQDPDLVARIMSLQCRQNTNYDIVRYAAHPFFLEGYTLMGNGENTMYTRNREFLSNLHPGYVGFESDTQCFLYTLHHVHHRLKWPLMYYKHVITPLGPDQLAMRSPEEQKTLNAIYNSLSFLKINGPNSIISVLPDGTMFSACDAKKLRPIVVRYDQDTAVFSSEVPAAEILLPHCENTTDIYPGESEIVLARPREDEQGLEVLRWMQ